MIKDIVLALEVGSSRDAARDYAISVAAAFDAHLAAIGFDFAPMLPPADTVNAIPFDILDAEREEATAGIGRLARFEEAARLAAVSAESRLVEGLGVRRYQCFRNDCSRVRPVRGRQVEPQSLRDNLMIEGPLFDSGRPVLVVPYIQRAGLKLDRVMVCWDGGRNAARAITTPCRFSPAPRRSMADHWGRQGQGGEIQGADIAQHLARHGLNVELRRIDAGDVDVANMILSDAADQMPTLS